MGMTDRAMMLSELKFQQKNIELIINTLLRNDYPVEFLFETISKRLKFLFAKRILWEKESDTNNNNNNINNNSDNLEKTLWFVILYTSSTSEKF